MKRERSKNEALKRRQDSLRASPGADQEQVENIREELSKLDGDKPYLNYKDLRVKNLERRNQ